MLEPTLLHHATQLPAWRLTHGPTELVVLDPRPSAAALGARYVHGGYVSAWSHAGRLLTARPHPAWKPYEGEGCPEVFEWGLGWGVAREGEAYLRIGAGRLRREGRGERAGEPVEQPVIWELCEATSTRVSLRCADALEIGGQRFAYALTRTVEAHADGFSSRTELWMQVPWNTPLDWFAHPFFAQTKADATGFHLPAGTVQMPEGQAASAEMVYHLPASGGLTNFTGLWGQREPLRLNLDPALGGGLVEITLDRPLDHLVVFGTAQCASPEPQLARSWKHGERTAWTLRYRFQAE